MDIVEVSSEAQEQNENLVRKSLDRNEHKDSPIFVQYEVRVVDGYT